LVEFEMKFGRIQVKKVRIQVFPLRIHPIREAIDTTMVRFSGARSF